MTKEKTLDARTMTLCALFTALIAAGAFIKLPIPYVPITLQFLFTNLAGLLLGSRRGLISVLLYIFIGLTGIPIFASGGGLSYVFQPTFGYIIGFALGTWLGGYLAEHGDKTVKSYILAGFANMALVFAVGLVYYYLLANYYLGNPIGAKTLLISGFLLCAPGDLVYCVVCGVMAKRLRPAIQAKRTA